MHVYVFMYVCQYVCMIVCMMYVTMCVCMYGPPLLWLTTTKVQVFYTEQLFSAANSELSIIPAAILHVNYSRDQQETFLLENKVYWLASVLLS